MDFQAFGRDFTRKRFNFRIFSTLYYYLLTKKDPDLFGRKRAEWVKLWKIRDAIKCTAEISTLMEKIRFIRVSELIHREFEN